VHLFNLKQFFGGGGAKSPQGKKDEEEDLGEAIPFAPGLWGKGVPSMDDLWREAWPVPACQDMMKRREMQNTYAHPLHTFSSTPNIITHVLKSGTTIRRLVV
jgi:hypothetical protein